MPRPRALLADADEQFIELVTKLIAGECEIVGTVRDGAAALAAATRLRPDLAVLGYALPATNGLDVAAELLKPTTAPRIVLVAGDEDLAVVPSALDAGVLACVIRRRVRTDLPAAVACALANRAFVSPLWD